MMVLINRIERLLDVKSDKDKLKIDDTTKILNLNEIKSMCTQIFLLDHNARHRKISEGLLLTLNTLI